MTYELHGKHVVAGRRLDGEEVFYSEPATGDPQQFSAGTAALVDRACSAAAEAFATFGQCSRAKRAELLDAVADAIESRGNSITEIGSSETGLPEARLVGERGRTTGQLRLFAEHIGRGDYLDVRHDPALPDRSPLPRPDLRVIQRPIGPVAVFGASNFPLAFSVAGGDTAAALAAGCPVVVKGHEAHPGTCEVVAECVVEAVSRTGLHPGCFSLVQGGNVETGQALVQHPSIQAVGFTGSLRGGRTLFDLCAARPRPIPFFGEMGSVNPMFVLPAALAARAGEIAEGWVASLTLGVGQFCTNPGIAVLVASDSAQRFVETAAASIADVAPQTMLTGSMVAAYAAGAERFANTESVEHIVSGRSADRLGAPNLFSIGASNWLQRPELHEEIFGPSGLLVLARDMDEMVQIASAFEGQLTATLHLEPADYESAGRLLPILEHRAGRVLANGYPTGVEVCDAMVHGGPYPASTNFGATSVGTLSIRRFLRPVCFQNFPPELLNEDLRSAD